MSIPFTHQWTQPYVWNDWASLDQSTWTTCRVMSGAEKVDESRPALEQCLGKLSLCASLSLKALVALVKIWAQIWVNAALNDGTLFWSGWIIFQFTACTGSVVPTQWPKPTVATVNPVEYVFHLYQEHHVAFPECTSNLLPHLNFQTKYQCSSHMCLWYIINLHLS